MAEFNAEPYWDDFDATNGALEKNYMRILFRPGYAVQARELTQIQSILQNQIKQFGNHIFQDGSPVVGGHLTLDRGVRYVKLEKQYNGQDIDLDNFFGVGVFNSGSPQVRARVLQTYSTTTDRTLLLRYTRGESFTAGETISTAATVSANVASGSFTGTGSLASINEGVFYVDGYFITVAPQTIVLDAYTPFANARVGLEIDEGFVTESEDNALLDPALESFNYQAPGAHRYKFNLVLAKRDLNSVDDSRFFELLRVENGVITKQVSYPIYSELEKTLARRTYDESGDYSVKPFIVSPKTHATNTDAFFLEVSAGKVYVKGFEFETIGPTKFQIPKARTYQTNADYNLNIYYGNRLQLANLRGNSADGIVFSTDYKPLDIHCVPNSNVVLDGTASKYYATKIGTAYLKNLDRTSGDANVYYAYLTDVKFDSIVTSANGVSTNAYMLKLSPHFSSVENAYKNAIVTLLTSANVACTSSVGNWGQLTCSFYDGATKYLHFLEAGTGFKATPSSGDRFTISVPLDMSKSVFLPNTSTFQVANLQANVASGSQTLGKTAIEDPTFDKSLYKLPDPYVVRNSENNVSFYQRTIFRNQQFSTNGAITISVPDKVNFEFGTDGSVVSDAEVNDNIIVVPREGVNAGIVLNMTEGNRSVLRVDANTISIHTDSGSGTTFKGDIYVTSRAVTAEDHLRRTKTYKQANSALTAGDSHTLATAVIGVPGVKLNLSNGIAWFMSANAITKIPGEPQQLYVSDVTKIRAVYDSGSLTTLPTTSSRQITSQYTLYSGSSYGMYNHAYLTFTGPAPTGQVAVLFDHYQYAGQGYTSAGSYSAAQYANGSIPIFIDTNKNSQELRDHIDLRPVRLSGTEANPYASINIAVNVNVAALSTTITANLSQSKNVLSPPITTGSMISVNGEIRRVESVINTNAIKVSSAFPVAINTKGIEVLTPNLAFKDTTTGAAALLKPTSPSTMELDYDYYLPRIDKLVVTRDKEFKYILGIPSVSPREPAVDDNSMELYKFVIPPYTADPEKTVVSTFIKNSRFTMKDIGRIETDLQAVKSRVTILENEKQTITNPPTSTTNPGVSKPVYYQLTEDFTNTTVADTVKDFQASIEKGYLGPYQQVNAFNLAPNLSDAMVNDKLITLTFTETPLVTQPVASPTGAQTVQPNMFAKYEGVLTLTPESDFFYSKEHQPALIDSIGKEYETPQSEPAGMVVDSAILAVTGGGIGYRTGTYNDPPITGDGIGTSLFNSVDIPDYSQLPSSFEPLSTVRTNISFTGVAPETFVNDTWTGGPIDIGSQTYNPYPPGWKYQGITPIDATGGSIEPESRDG